MVVYVDYGTAVPDELFKSLAKRGQQVQTQGQHCLKITNQNTSGRRRVQHLVRASLCDDWVVSSAPVGEAHTDKATVSILQLRPRDGTASLPVVAPATSQEPAASMALGRVKGSWEPSADSSHAIGKKWEPDTSFGCESNGIPRKVPVTLPGVQPLHTASGVSSAGPNGSKSEQPTGSTTWSKIKGIGQPFANAGQTLRKKVKC